MAEQMDLTSFKESDDTRSLLVTVNAVIDRLHESLGLPETDFFCECGRVACKERLTLSRLEYASLIEHSRRVVVPEHQLQDGDAELVELRQTVKELQSALVTRVKIEQAKGVMAERHGITTEDAFETLRRRARSQQRRLEDVCSEIVARAGTIERRESGAHLSEVPRQQVGDSGGR